MSAVLEAEGLTRRYGARTVLDVEYLAVHAGEVLAVVGPNGAGKSTLFRTLLLLDAPERGTVRLNGADMKPGDARARGRIAGVFQRPVLFTGSVRDNVAFGLRATGTEPASARARVAEALGWMQLEHLADAAVHRLSGGEAQRVALARALVLEPDVVLLDEPTSNLDVTIRRQFRQDIERVARQRARSIVLITHDAGEAFGLADRIAVLHDGRVVQTGRPDELVMQPATPFIAELTGAELLLQGTLERVEDGLAAIRIGNGISVWAVAPAHVRRGDAVVVAYRPEDVTISTSPHDDTSAMNMLSGQIDGIAPAGALMRVRIRAGDVMITALVTRRSLDTLGLEPGLGVTMHMKAAALHAWARGNTGAEGR